MNISLYKVMKNNIIKKSQKVFGFCNNDLLIEVVLFFVQFGSRYGNNSGFSEKIELVEYR